jgi:hypothetical protein|tara:strand:+ start:419 stop:661 length:243 start_codon:yes stop_codon:yes gene_type:complete
MWTVEFEDDHFEIVILDDTGVEEDIKVELEDEGVFISQYCSIMDEEQNIRISHKQWEELLLAVNSPEGAFIKVDGVLRKR